MSNLIDGLKKAADANREILAVLGDDEAGTLPKSDKPAPAAAPESERERNTGGPAPSPYRTASVRLAGRTPIMPFDGSAPRAADQYRMIRTRILHHPRAPKILLISSPSPRDGKTITAVNLAVALALKSDSTVLLVDGDLRRPGVAAVLGIPGEPGLTNVLENACALEDAIVRIGEVPGLFVLPAGQTKPNPTELLDSAKWAEICATVGQRFQHVVIDSPPVSAVADYELLEKAADGVVTVIRPDQTNRSLVFKVLDSIPREKQLGLVVNSAPDWLLFRPAASYYYDHY